MFDADQVLKQHNVNQESVMKWAKQIYPSWEPQGQAVKKAYCYLVLKYHPPPMYRPRGELIPLSMLEIGDSADAQFTVLGLVEERNYNGCPKGHSVAGKTVGETAVCEKCSEMVKVENIIVGTYEITDGKEVYPATFFRGQLPEGALITANVTVRNDGVFGIWRYKVDEKSKVTNDGISSKTSEELGDALVETNLSDDGSKTEEVKYLTCPACEAKLKPIDDYANDTHRTVALNNHIRNQCTKKAEALAIMKDKR